MAINNVLLVKKLHTARLLLRGMRDQTKAGLRGLDDGDQEMTAALRPFLQTFDTKMDEAIASVTAAIQATTVTNADKVAFANAELGKDAT